MLINLIVAVTNLFHPVEEKYILFFHQWVKHI